MKYLCINNLSVTLPVARGYPNTLPNNGNMSLLFLKEVKYAAFDTPEFLKDGSRFGMQVGELYDSCEEKVNFYGVPLLRFEGYYGFRPKCCFIPFDILDVMEEEVNANVEKLIKRRLIGF